MGSILAPPPLAVFLVFSVFQVFSVFLVLSVFGVGVGAGGLGDGLLSRWGLPAWVRFPPLAVFLAFLVVLVYLVVSVFGLSLA